MKMWKAALGVTLALIANTGSQHLLAQEPPKLEMKCEQRFADMDTNKDKKVTLKEFMAVKHPTGNAPDNFKARDTDKNGTLTKKEFCTKSMGMGQGQSQIKKRRQNGY